MKYLHYSPPFRSQFHLRSSRGSSTVVLVADRSSDGVNREASEEALEKTPSFGRSSLNISSQSYVTWMTWAALEQDQGKAIHVEEIRNLYFQQ